MILMPLKPYSLLRAPVLDIILACLDLAPRDHRDALRVERRHDILPLRHLLYALVVGVARLREHLTLDGLEEGGDAGGDVLEGQRGLRTGIAANGERGLLLEVLGADLEAKGNTLGSDTSARVNLYKTYCHTFCSQSLNL